MFDATKSCWTVHDNSTNGTFVKSPRYGSQWKKVPKDESLILDAGAELRLAGPISDRPNFHPIVFTMIEQPVEVEEPARLAPKTGGTLGTSKRQRQVTTAAAVPAAAAATKDVPKPIALPEPASKRAKTLPLAPVAKKPPEKRAQPQPTPSPPPPKLLPPLPPSMTMDKLYPMYLDSVQQSSNLQAQLWHKDATISDLQRAVRELQRALGTDTRPDLGAILPGLPISKAPGIAFAGRRVPKVNKCTQTDPLSIGSVSGGGGGGRATAGQQQGGENAQDRKRTVFKLKDTSPQGPDALTVSATAPSPAAPAPIASAPLPASDPVEIIPAPMLQMSPFPAAAAPAVHFPSALGAVGTSLAAAHTSSVPITAFSGHTTMESPIVMQALVNTLQGQQSLAQSQQALIQWQQAQQQQILILSQQQNQIMGVAKSQQWFNQNQKR